MIRFDGVEIDMQHYVVRHAGNEIRFRGRYRWKLTCALLLGSGYTTTQLADRLYGSRDDGGPEWYTNVVAEMIYLARPIWRRVSLETKKEKRSGQSYYYRLVPTKGETE